MSMNLDYTIFSVEDDSEIAEVINLSLKSQGFNVFSFGSGEEFLGAIKLKKPNMVLLDLMLPGVQGIDVLKKLKSDPDFRDVVIVIVSAKSMVQDRIEGLDLGADDYIPKPFDINELISRINAHYRRHIQSNIKETSNAIVIGERSLDTDNKVVRYQGKLVDLTPSEYKVAEMLFVGRGKVVNKNDIAVEIYGETTDADRLKKQYRTIDMHIKAIREKLGDTEKNFIKTVFNAGYRID